MKEFFRSMAQKHITFNSKCKDKPKIVFSILNRFVKSIVEEAAKENEIHFLPELFDNYLREDSDSCTYRGMIAGYKDYFQDKSFFVIDRLPRNDVNRMAAVEGAKQSPCTKIVYLDHGETGFSDPIGQIHWLRVADYYYANNTETKHYIQELAQRFDSDVVVRERRRTLSVKWNRDKNSSTILFAPSFYNSDLFIGQYSDTMKYKHRKFLVDHFNYLSYNCGESIVWSGLSSSNENVDPISIKPEEYFFDYIEGQFNKLLSTCSYFLTDAVSTPFYDACDLGIPALCFYWKGSTPIREAVRRQFGKSIFVFDDVQEVKEEIGNLLGSYDQYINPVIHGEIDKYPWEKSI